MPVTGAGFTLESSRQLIPGEDRRAVMSDLSGPDLIREVATVLWPESEGIAVGRRNPFGASADVKSFTVVPSLRRPIYLVPRARGAAVALNPSVGGLRSVSRRTLAHLQRTGLLSRLLGSRIHIKVATSGLEQVLASVVGDVEDLVIRLGRPRVNRAIVFWVLGTDGAPRAVAKAATGAEGRAKLETEYAALCQRPCPPIAGLRLPEPLAYLRWQSLDILVLSPLIASDPARVTAPPIPQMIAMADSAGRQDLPLGQTAYVANLWREIAKIREPSDQAWLRAELRLLLESHGDQVVRTGTWHGDWVSWNMTTDGEDVLLWDWEHYQADALAGLDHIHFLAQEVRHRATDEAAENAWLIQAREALGSAWDLSREQQDVVIRAYLIDLNARYMQDWQDNHSRTDRLGWGRPLVERLARAAEPRVGLNRSVRRTGSDPGP